MIMLFCSFECIYLYDQLNDCINIQKLVSLFILSWCGPCGERRKRDPTGINHFKRTWALSLSRLVGRRWRGRKGGRGFLLHWEWIGKKRNLDTLRYKTVTLLSKGLDDYQSWLVVTGNRYWWGGEWILRHTGRDIQKSVILTCCFYKCVTSLDFFFMRHGFKHMQWIYSFWNFKTSNKYKHGPQKLLHF